MYKNKFELVYNKYINNITIKKLIGYKSRFKYKWNLWFHSSYDNNWGLDSYVKIYTISNRKSFWEIFNNHYNLLNGMYFLMKENINPIYEDKHNIKGGYWSIKVNSQDIKEVWLYICMDLISGNMDKKNIINGLSICNKRKFYIIKIWIKDCIYNNIDYININIKNINKNSILFNKFTN